MLLCKQASYSTIWTYNFNQFSIMQNTPENIDKNENSESLEVKDEIQYKYPI